MKNVVVLFPLMMSMHIADAPAVLNALLATVAFCMASSFTYVLNDIYDRSRDALHPRKKDRPLASGRIDESTAAIAAVVLAVLAGAAVSVLGIATILVLMAYLLVHVAYTYWLKEKMLLDVMCIAGGFVLRALAGATAIHVTPTPWLFICTFTLCMFMGFCKRYMEIVAIGDSKQAIAHRPTLVGYTAELLTHVITLSAAIAVISFLLYSLSDQTVQRIGTNYLAATLPLVVYGVFRFAMLSIHGLYSDPTDLILRDRPFQVTAVVWIAAGLIIVYWGRGIQAWLAMHY